MRIALTGGIACGKSLFAKFLRELGVQTLDADDIVHELIPEAERRRLAPIVFADPEARKALEARIHPAVGKGCAEWFAAESQDLRVAVIPLLFECHWDVDYDIILCISSPADLQIRRMMETRGMTHAAAIARLNAQLPVSEKVARSHFVVVNDSSAEHLCAEARRCVTWLNDAKRRQR